MSVVSDSYRPSLPQEIWRWTYSFIWWLLVPLLLTHFLVTAAWRDTEENKRRLARFGCGRRADKPGGILLHCVSVGEVMAASILVKRILADKPATPITITTTTQTGARRVAEIFGNKVQHRYLPYDLPVTMASLLKHIKPDLVLIMEVELWPNFIHCCWQQQIPVYVINARMTDRSLQRYRKLRALVAPMLGKIRGICAQGQRDYENYVTLGATKGRLFLTHNIKFDLPKMPREPLYQEIRNQFDLHGRQILIAGSTHDPEEKMLLAAFQRLKTRFPPLLLILVPRHPQRFENVATLITSSNLNLVRVSDRKACDEHTDVLLADQMGILSSLYAAADIAFVGGSLADKGGHNALEPAAFGVPILMGPSRHNNPQICEQLAASGALQLVENEAQLADKAGRWLNDNQQAHEAGNAGRAIIQSSRGATEATLKRIFADYGNASG